MSPMFPPPMSVMRDAKIAPNDALDVSYRQGSITLTVQKALHKKPPLSAYVGSVVTLYGKTAAQVRKYIQSERVSWER